MKRLNTMILMLVLVLSVTIFSGAEADVYTDSEVGFQFTIPDGWEIVGENDLMYSLRDDMTRVMLQSVEHFGGTIKIKSSPDKVYTKESIKQIGVEGVKKLVLSSIASIVSPKITSVEEIHNGSTMLYVAKYEEMGMHVSAIALTTTNGSIILIEFNSLINYEENEPGFIQLVESFALD